MTRTVVERLTDHFVGEAPAGLLAAYLFGSEAAGRAHRQSDVDVGVLLDRGVYRESLERAEFGIRLASALIHALGRNEIDVVVLNDAPPELGRAIIFTGVRVYCADAEADHGYRRDVQLRAADLVPFLQRMRKIKLEVLRG